MEEIQNYLQKQTALLDESEEIIRQLDSAIDEIVDMEYQCSDDVVLTMVGKLHITYLSCMAYLKQVKEVVDILQNRPE